MKIRVFTAFSGYDSQCMALDRLHEQFPDFEYELVGWAEIDKYAIQAHNAVYPQWADRNFGDISKIDWDAVPDFDLFTYSSPCQDFSSAGKQRGGKKVQEHAHLFSGNAVEPSSPSDPSIYCLRMWLRSYRRSFFPCSTNGKRSSPPTDTTTSRRCSMPRTMAYPKIVSVYSSCLSSMRMPPTASPRRCHSPSDSKMCSNKMWMRSII